MIAGRASGQRKVRTPQGREVRNANWGRPEGKCHRKYTAGLRPVRVKRWGKSPPPSWRHEGHGKPLPEQNQIGKRSRTARPKLPGRLQEVPGDRHPREMIMAPFRGTESGLQPTPFFSFCLAPARQTGNRRQKQKPPVQVPHCLRRITPIV